jgi:RimJ/RimL family protein N-acetyltransferase
MRYIKTYENHSNITFEVKKRMRNVVSCNYAYLKDNGKIVSKCIFFTPSKNGNEWLIYDGGSIETFDSGKIAKVYLVESKEKGKGLGTLLFNKLEEYLKNIGIRQIHLDVDVNNIRAQEFYKKLGFKEKWKGFDSYRYCLNI